MFQCFNVFKYFQGCDSKTKCELQVEQHIVIGIMVIYIFLAYEVVVLEFA